MAAKFVVLAFAAIATTVVSAKDCDCKDLGDTKELWDFLKKLSPDLDNLTDEENEMYYVLPGILSPLMECPCPDGARRKRALAPSEEIAEPLSEESKLRRLRSLRQRKSIRFGTRHCPAGFAKVGYLCVKEELLE